MRTALMFTLLLAGAAGAHEHEPAAGHERAPGAPVAVHADARGSVFGAALPKDLPTAVSIDRAAGDPKQHAGKLAAYSGRITQVCQKQGCWLVLSGDDGGFARVAMHDHAFSVPKDASGPAIVYGTLSEKINDQAEIDHLVKDGAKAPAPRELAIDAVSVLIPAAG
jgi:hypothetical protein